MSTTMCDVNSSSPLPPSPRMRRPNSLLPQEDVSDTDNSSTSSCNSVQLQNVGDLSPVVYTNISQRLSQLLWDLAEEDTSYNGCELFSPVWNQSQDLLSYSKAGTVFSPMEGSPSDKPRLFFERTPTPSEAYLPPFLKMLSREISCDGPGQSKAMIWSLRIGPDGKLFVFNNGKPVNSPSGEVMGGQLHHSNETGAVHDYVYFCHGNTLMELNAKSPPSMRHSIGPIDKGMNIKTQPVDSTDGGHRCTFSSEAAAYMALDYTDAENPLLKSFPEAKLVEMLEDLKKKGKSLSEVKIMPIVNIWVTLNDKPNQIALFFTGDKYRYYVHVDGGKLILVSKKLNDIKKDDDWRDHVQFSNNLTNPPCEECTDTSSLDTIPRDKNVSLDPESQSNGDQFQSRPTPDNDTTSPVKKKLNMCEASTSLVNSFQIPSSATEEAKRDSEP